MPHDQILDILFAWEEVHKSKYLPQTGKFVPVKPKGDSRKSSASEGDKKASIKALESKIEELEKGMAKAAKEKASRSNDWLAMPLTQQTVDDYKDSSAGLTGWMLCALDLISKAVEEISWTNHQRWRLLIFGVWLSRVRSNMRGSTPALTKGRRVPKRSDVRDPDRAVGPIHLRARAAGPGPAPDLGRPRH